MLHKITFEDFLETILILAQNRIIELEGKLDKPIRQDIKKVISKTVQTNKLILGYAADTLNKPQ